MKVKKNWNIEDSKKVFLIDRWGKNFFSINEEGNISIKTSRKNNIDLKKLVDSIVDKGISLPLLLRFNDILKRNIENINSCFQKSIKKFNYDGKYQGVYPIKVNQQSHVVKDILKFGKKFNIGLEAGSKAELMIAALYSEKNIILCNGYKDNDYLKTALNFTKLGKNIFIIIEKLSELNNLIDLSNKFKVTPNIGIRIKLSTISKGHWEKSSGDKSKFGLSISELLMAIDILKRNNFITSFKLIHTHIGSQITSIKNIKTAFNEFARIYSELISLNIPIEYFDVGGGLGIDYDGSKSDRTSSMNYTRQEYANDIVYSINNICELEKIAKPTIISESGRALVAHSSIIIFNVSGNSILGEEEVIKDIKNTDNEIIREMIILNNNINENNYREFYHDAIQCKEESVTLFTLGLLSLTEKGEIDKLFWQINKKISKIMKSINYIPEELKKVEHLISSTYYCNFSIFQSIPDFWAINQLFPITPIHRLNEKPEHKAILCDITCDSDGKIDEFIGMYDTFQTLPLHNIKNKKPYYLGIFLVGAYQETLGDFHNLFGDINILHISISGKDNCKIEKHIKNDRIIDVLTYVQYSKNELYDLMNNLVEDSINKKDISIKERNRIIDEFEKVINGTTYLI